MPKIWKAEFWGNRELNVALVIAALIIGAVLGIVGSNLWLNAKIANLEKQVDALQTQVNAKPAVTLQPASQTASADACSTCCQDKKYPVVQGDVLSKIVDNLYGAKGYQTELIGIVQKANGLKNPNLIMVGQILTIPGCLFGLKPLPTQEVRAVKKQTPTPKRTVVRKTAPKPAPVTPQVVEGPKGPQGPKGDKGDTGPQGPKGDPGTTTVIHVVEPPAPAPPPPAASAPAPAPPEKKEVTVQLRAVPSRIKRGQSALLEWTTMNADRVVIVPAVGDDKPKPPNGTEQVSPTVDTFYTATAFGPEGMAVGQATITVEEERASEEPRFSGRIVDAFRNFPNDKHNFANTFRVDEGVTVAHLPLGIVVQPFVAGGGFNARRDFKYNAWDQSFTGEAGVRLLKPFKDVGFLETGGSWMGELRGAGLGHPLRTKTAPSLFFNGAFRWFDPGNTPDQKALKAFPGLTEFTVRKSTPFEKNNLTEFVHIEQGVTVGKIAHVFFIPEVIAGIGHDSQKLSWNNRYDYGLGLRLAFPLNGNSTFNVTPGYGCSNQYAGAPVRHENGCAPTLGVGYTFSWGGKK